MNELVTRSCQNISPGFNTPCNDFSGSPFVTLTFCDFLAGPLHSDNTSCLVNARKFMKKRNVEQSSQAVEAVNREGGGEAESPERVL